MWKPVNNADYERARAYHRYLGNQLAIGCLVVILLPLVVFGVVAAGVAIYLLTGS